MKFKSKYFLAPILAASLAVAPLSAQARGWHDGYRGHDHFGRGFGVGAAVGGLLVGTAMLLTAPIRAVGEVVAEPAYPTPYPQQAYYQEAPRYYEPAPRYYAPAPRYYQQAPYGGYYAPAAAYYPY